MAKFKMMHNFFKFAFFILQFSLFNPAQSGEFDTKFRLSLNPLPRQERRLFSLAPRNGLGALQNVMNMKCLAKVFRRY
jgi:hypothetical protein